MKEQAPSSSISLITGVVTTTLTERLRPKFIRRLSERHIFSLPPVCLILVLATSSSEPVILRPTGVPCTYFTFTADDTSSLSKAFIERDSVMVLAEMEGIMAAAASARTISFFIVGVFVVIIVRRVRRRNVAQAGETFFWKNEKKRQPGCKPGYVGLPVSAPP